MPRLRVHQMGRLRTSLGRKAHPPEDIVVRRKGLNMTKSAMRCPNCYETADAEYCASCEMTFSEAESIEASRIHDEAQGLCNHPRGCGQVGMIVEQGLCQNCWLGREWLHSQALIPWEAADRTRKD
jgi:hypothetical protein